MGERLVGYTLHSGKVYMLVRQSTPGFAYRINESACESPADGATFSVLMF